MLGRPALAIRDTGHVIAADIIWLGSPATAEVYRFGGVLHRRWVRRRDGRDVAQGGDRSVGEDVSAVLDEERVVATFVGVGGVVPRRG